MTSVSHITHTLFTEGRASKGILALTGSQGETPTTLLSDPPGTAGERMEVPG